jgi:hypothetical protein
MLDLPHQQPTASHRHQPVQGMPACRTQNASLLNNTNNNLLNVIDDAAPPQRRARVLAITD